MNKKSLSIGTGAIAYREWKGKFYPRNLKQDDAFAYYAQVFSALEINDTFYRLPSKQAIRLLVKQAPKRFFFAVKMTGLITHMKRLKNVGKSVKAFFAALEPLKRRGAVLIQLPPNFKKDLPRLVEFARLLPRGFSIAYEFRHPTWFDDDVFAFLRKKRAALVWNDTDVKMPYVPTADWGLVRLRKPTYVPADLKKWKTLLLRQPWKKATVVFKHEEKAAAPELARRLKGIL